MNCNKCGKKLDTAPYGPLTRDSVAALAGDHASKDGCDYVARFPDKVFRDLKVEKSKP